MRCTKCEFDNPAGMKFCGKCRTALGQICSNCSFENPPEFNFCGQCAAPLLGAAGITKGQAAAPKLTAAVRPDAEEAATPLEGERKTVTALFADIKGSTELMEDLDPEEARAIIDPALRIMIEAARRFDGYIVQSTGDGIFALFGAPVAHEDHPQRALHAALRMQAAILTYAAKLRAEGRVPIEIRVGIHTGEVVVRSIETGERTEYTPIGHTTNLASRLQAIAPTGAIVLSGETARLVTGYFALKALGPVRVKGVSAAIEVFEAVGLGPLRTRLQVSAMRGLTKFCGRITELDRVKHALELARAGHGQVLCAAGEAGVGKSRLFYEFNAVATRGCLVLETFAVSHGKASPYLPVIQLLEDYFAIADSDDLRRRREKAGGKVLMLDRTLDDTLPYLFTLMGIQEGDDPLARMDPQIKRQRTLEAIRRVLMRESANQPLILIFEDLHWIDGASQALLDLLVDSIEHAPILMLLNFRPEYRHQWAGRGYQGEIEVRPLPVECTQELLTALLGPSPALADLKRMIFAQTEGNPFFIEEIVRALFEQGILARTGEVTLTRSLGEVRIPQTVQGIISARIDRLPPAQRDLLQTVAVLGREFPASLARELAGALDDQFEGTLADLEAGDFIYEESDSHGTRYAFKHVLTQEVAYGSLLGEQRRALHDRAAGAIEKIFAGRLDDHLADLANHHTRGGNAFAAVHYLELAGRQAARRAAYPEAADHMTAALKLIATMPPSDERDRLEIQMLTALAQFLIPMRGPGAEEVRQPFDRARELCERMGDPNALFWVVFGLQFSYMMRHELETARTLGLEQLAIAERTQFPAMLMGAYIALAQTLVLLGEFSAAADLCRRALALPVALPGYPLSDVGEPRPMILSIMSTALMAMGFPLQALERGEQAIALARRAGPYSIALALSGLAQIQREVGDIAVALENLDALDALAAENGFSLWSAQAAVTRGRVLLGQGHFNEAIALLRSGAAVYETSGAATSFSKIAVADALGHTGAVREALKLIDETIDQIERSGMRVAESLVYLVQSGLYLQLGGAQAQPAAEASLRKSIEVARRQASRSAELRATMSLAQLLRDTGRRDEARTMLSEIYKWFTEGFDTADLKDAKALLDQLAE
jgi:class 3 adenylate cyclase/tetratricopeptide (TPR) repeat protein